MYGKLRLFVMLFAVVAMLSTVASAGVFSDDFESYVVGSDLHGQAGWKGWDNNAAYGALVADDVAFGGSKSVAIGGSSDLVHTFDAVGGAWVVSAMQYIPGNATGKNYFILLNQYNDGGPYNWSTQLTFDLDTGKVGDVDIVRDAWKEVRVEVDLDANTRMEYYDGTLVGSGAWYTDGSAAIAAIDLYSENPTPVYYDDVQLVPEPATLTLLLGSLLALPVFGGLRRGRKS